MPRRVLAVFAISLLALAAPASAGHRVFAIDEIEPARCRSGENLRPLAEELERAVAWVHQEAERQAHHFDRNEWRALVRLDRLHGEALRFRSRLERHGRHAVPLRRDLAALLSAYDDAALALARVHARRPVERGFERVEHLMVRLLDEWRDRGHRDDLARNDPRHGDGPGWRGERR